MSTAEIPLSQELLSADFRGADNPAFSTVTTTHGLFGTQQVARHSSRMGALEGAASD